MYATVRFNFCQSATQLLSGRRFYIEEPRNTASFLRVSTTSYRIHSCKKWRKFLSLMPKHENGQYDEGLRALDLPDEEGE